MEWIRVGQWAEERERCLRVLAGWVVGREANDHGWDRGAEWFRAVRFAGQESKVTFERRSFEKP